MTLGQKKFTAQGHGPKQDKCHALVMSGGGVNGAWEAGVLYGLIKYGPKEEYQWDVVSGISIGCVNSSGVAIWDKGNEEKMVEWMSNVWDTLKTTDIY